MILSKTQDDRAKALQKLRDQFENNHRQLQADYEEQVPATATTCTESELPM